MLSNIRWVGGMTLKSTGSEMEGKKTTRDPIEWEARETSREHLCGSLKNKIPVHVNGVLVSDAAS